MRLIFTSYSSSPEYKQPVAWLKRIEGFTCIMESLAREHNVMSIEKIDYEGVYGQNNVEYYFTRLKKKTIRFPLRMHRLIKSLRPNVVFVHGFIFPLQIMQLRWKLGKKVKIIVINRSERPASGIRKYLQKLADSRIDAHFFTTLELARPWLQQGIIGRKEKVYEIMHGASVFVQEDKTSAQMALKVEGSPVFIFVGRLDANKDPLTVIHSFTRFLSVAPLARLYMVYQGEELLQPVRDLINADEKAKSAIILIGALPHPELQKWYSSADFIISASHYEGGGIAVCEAMSCGCIPILTDIASFRNLTGAGQCGFLYETGNREALLQVLLKTKEMDIRKEQEKVLLRYKNEFSYTAIADKISKAIVNS